jgi:hypothetical protein
MRAQFGGASRIGTSTSGSSPTSCIAITHAAANLPVLSHRWRLGFVRARAVGPQTSFGSGLSLGGDCKPLQKITTG